MDRMLLLLKPSPGKQAELDALIQAQQNPTSPLYHQWLTPAEYGARFGASPQDLSLVTAWLAAHGLRRGSRFPQAIGWWCFPERRARSSMPFTQRFTIIAWTESTHIANSQDPQIPAALSGVISGVVSFSDFRRTSQINTRTPLPAQTVSGPSPLYSSGSTHYLSPKDFAAIYNLDPLYQAGTAGAGTSIAIAGRSNINLSDVAAFRLLSSLPANTPSVIVVGQNPGLVAE